MIKAALTLLLIFFLQSCNQGPFGGDVEKNMAEMDKIHGKCNNPYRTFNKAQKRICEDKERAAGPDGEVGDPINLTKLIENYKNFTEGINNTTGGGLSVNENLWGASLILLDQYPLDIVDAQGGFISTSWITEKDNPNLRCLIKVNVTSKELISTGINVKLLCQEKELETWYQDGISYEEEEKRLTLKILDIADELSTYEKLS